MKTILVSTAALLLTTTTAIAGSYTTPAPLPPIPAPVAANDWGGFYVGGMANSNGGDYQQYVGGFPAGPSYPFTDTPGYGAFAGYNIQRGAFVFGAELSYTSLDMPVTVAPAFRQTYFADAKLRVGYSFGKVMVYAVGGYSMGFLDVGLPVNQTGYVYGAGADFMVTDNLFMGLEYSNRVIGGDINASSSAESTIQSVALRVGWNF